MQLFLLTLVQSIGAVIWRPQIYSISVFSLYFGHLDRESDTLNMVWTTSIEPRNSGGTRKERGQDCVGQVIRVQGVPLDGGIGV